MRVKATREGYYDLKRRKVGSVFTLHDPKAFSNNWMINLDEDKASSPKGKKPVVREEEVDHDEDVI